tara:strand:- start:717 stop:1061 length:345 start_codon:yes stop_codon:yes gene_type:complete
MQDKIKQKCNEVRDLLLSKNKSYGNSVFERGVVFDVEPIYAIKARINDKLNRLRNNDRTFSSENDLQDLTGYLILLQVMIDDVKSKGTDAPLTEVKEEKIYFYESNRPKPMPGI